MYPKLKPLYAAIYCSTCLSAVAQTATTENLAPVIVTASRFAEECPVIPANVTIIDRREIAASPARSLPDLLKIQAGVDIRSLYGPLGIDASVDIRGIGEAGASNTLILLDGQRLNPADMGSIKWETVPLASVDHIEIIRGSGSVMYGDRASSGVINIITKKDSGTHAGAGVELGSHGYGAIDASISGNHEAWSGRLFVNSAHTDGWRDNNDATRTAANGGISYAFTSGKAFVDFSAYQENYGLPSSLSKTQYQNTPNLASTPNYRMDRQGWLVRPGTEIALNDRLALIIDGSIAHDERNSENKDWAYRSHSTGNTYALSPRLKWSHGLPGALTSITVFGSDFYKGEIKSDSLDFDSRAVLNHQTASLTNYGFYAQNASNWLHDFDSTIGVRKQYFREEVADQSNGLSDSLNDSLTAWEIGGGYQLANNLRSYIKAARNFRLPNTDELFAYNCASYPCTTVFNGTLKPQTGHLKELGLQWNTRVFSQQLAIYQQDNENEIGYISANGKNANLDPLRRRGMESETRWSPAANWTIRLMLTFVDARFTEGNYDGKWVPLVPKHKEALTVQWDGGQVGTHTVVLNNVGSRYFGSDFVNTRDKLGDYTTVDYQASWRLKPFVLGFRVTNLTDTKYSPTGYSGKYYPADRRSLFASLNYAY